MGRTRSKDEPGPESHDRPGLGPVEERGGDGEEPQEIGVGPADAQRDHDRLLDHQDDEDDQRDTEDGAGGHVVGGAHCTTST